MIKIRQLCSHIVDLIGEETLCRELEGILRKHNGLNRRIRRPGRVDLCANDIKNHLEKESCPVPIAARIIQQYHLSPASTYRVVKILRRQGFVLRAADILREQKRMRSGVY